MNRRNIFLWTLYDFANSIVVIVFFLYFSQWLVIDKGVSDFWYNMIFTAGSIFLLLTAPVMGTLADRNDKQLRYLNITTVIVVLLFGLTSIVTLFWSNSVYLAVVFFLFANYLYQLTFVFYNALLYKIAPPEKWGRISGIGQAGNWVGQIVGLLVTLPLATGAIYLFGEPGRAQVFLPSVAIFFVLTLPMLIWFKLPKANQTLPPITLADNYRGQWKRFKKLIKLPNVGLFLLSYFFFNDAILTAANNFPIYLQKVFAVSDSTKSLLMIGILATSALGALGAGFVADKLGLKKTLTLILASWIVILPLLGLVTNFKIFVGCTIVMGFLYGAVWTVTRASMTALCPADQMNFGFSFYGVAERVSTLVGPVTWGLITSLLLGLGASRYRLAVISMTVFVVVGLIILRKIEIRQTNVSI